MSRFRSIALGLAVLAGAAPAVHAQATQQPAPRAERHEFAARRHNLMRGLFHGIALTDAEKANVKAVRQKYQPQLKSIFESMRPALKDARAARQRGDTAAAKAAFEKTRDQREQARKLMEQARQDVRAALTPEHQKQFDANVARLRERLAQRRHPGAWQGRRSGDTKDQKGSL